MCHLKNWIKGISAVLCVITLTCAAQASSFVWTRGLSPSAGGAGKCVGTDGQGNVYLAGNFAGSVSIGNTNLQSGTNAYTSSFSKIFLAKYDEAGNVSWAVQGGGVAGQDVNAIFVDSPGSLYVAGTFYMAPMVLGDVTLPRTGYTNTFFAKFSDDGQIVWAKSIVGDSLSTIVAKGLAVDRDGNVYMTGWFDRLAQFDGVSINVGPTYSQNGFLAKYDQSGNLQWVKNMGGVATANAIAVDGEGNPIVAGMYRGSTLSGVQLPYFYGYPSVFVAKYDPQGNTQWVQGAGGGSNDVAIAVGVDQSNSIYVSGNFQHRPVFGDYSLWDYYDWATPGGAAPGKPGDVFLAKYSADGSVLWARQYGSGGTDICNGLLVDDAGNCHLTGASTNAVFFANFDSCGLFMRTQTAGNNSANKGQGVASDKLGNIYATGVIGGTNQIFGPDTLTNATIFLTKLAVFDPTNPPVISTQISNQTAIVASNCVFSIGVTSDSPLSYQWQFNGVDIPQATNSILQFSNPTFAASGIYDVIISNSHGAVTSSFASLTVEFPQEFTWARKAGGANFDEARAVTVDTNGNSYVTGVFQTIADFGSLKLTNYNASTSSFNWDIFIAKYDPAGNVLWVRQAGGTNTDEPRAIAVDREGSVYIAGTYKDSAQFDSIVLTNYPLHSSAFFAKYNSDGNVIWVQRLPPFSEGSLDIAQPYGIGVDSTNGIYLAGGVNGHVQIGTNIVSQGFFLAKANSDGNFEWVQTGSSTNASSPVVCNGQGVAVDSEDRIFVTGYFFRDVMRFGTNILNQKPGESYTGQRGFVARYDAAGNLFWVQKIFIADSQPTAVAADGLGNVFVTGRYSGEEIGGVYFAGQPMPEDSSTNLFLVKYDAMGTPLWGRGVGGTNYFDYCAGISLAADGLGSVYVAGTNRNPYSTGVRYQTKFAPTTLVDGGGFVAKYGTAGKFLWARSAGTYAKSVFTMGTNAWVAGSFTETRNFGITNLLNGGGSDIYIAKLGINQPKLNAQPTNQLVILGSNATLRVTTSGTGPLSYQWFLNGVAISGATSSTLTLTNVQGANAGSYSVAVSNPAGTVNSSVGVVNVVPVADVPRVDGTNLVISWADGFTLQISTNGVAGPYYDVPSATSPLTNSMETPEQYFRLRN